jgi:hypothetical protein
LGTKPTSPEQQPPQTETTLPEISHEHVINHPPPSTNDKSTIPKRIRPPTSVNINRWNTSTHAKPNSYLPDLADAYPRDPFTKMPPKRDAVEVYRLLQSIEYILLFFSRYELFRHDIKGCEEISWHEKRTNS